MNVTCHKCGKSFEVELSPSEIHTKNLGESTRKVICPYCKTENVVDVKE